MDATSRESQEDSLGREVGTCGACGAKFSAIPLLAGPGTITSILLLTAWARGSLALLAVIAAAPGVVFSSHVS